jgi:ornithine cyclodeaminase
MDSLALVDADTLASALSWDQAIDALDVALAAGLDLAGAPPRTRLATPHGELLLMPAQAEHAVGVKLVSVVPGNPAVGRPRIQGVYVLFDAATMSPRAVIDGAALTTLRTPALSALAVRRLAAASASRLTVFGSGPQARAHVHAIRTVRPISTVTIVGRDHARAEALADELTQAGLAARVGDAGDAAGADVVVCATTARKPIFDAEQLSQHACVVGVGAHEPDAREISEAVFARAQRVVVEERATALREAGDVIMAVAAGALDPDSLVDVAALRQLAPVEGITVFKSVGMGWQDLAVAEAGYAAWLATKPP